MVLEIKYPINTIVKKKYDRSNENAFHILEVLEIVTQTCYKDTQIFYLCRPIIGKRLPHSDEWEIFHGISNKESINAIGWEKYREDELVDCPQEILDIINN